MCSKKTNDDKSTNMREVIRDGFNMMIAAEQLRQQHIEQEIRIQQIRNEEMRRRKEQARQNYLQHFNAMQQNYAAGDLLATIEDCLNAIRCYRESCDTQLTRDDNVVLITLYFNLGKCCHSLHRYDEAIRYCEEGLALFPAQDAPHKQDITKLLINIAMARGDIDLARNRLNGFLRPMSLHLQPLYFQTALHYLGRSPLVIQAVDAWEAENNLILQQFQRCINLLPQNNLVDPPQRRVLITQLRQNLCDFENLFLMKAHALMRTGEYIKAAQYINRIIKYIELTTQIAWINRRYELVLLTHTISLCFAFEISTNNHYNIHLRGELQRGIREIRDLVAEYHSNKDLLNYPDHNFIISMTHYMLRDWLPIIARPDNLEALAQMKIYAEQDRVMITEISNSWADLLQNVINLADVHNYPRTLLRYFLETGFMRDYYDPINLMLYSRCIHLGVPNIAQRANLAKAHLAFCLIHAHRIKRDFVRAWESVADASNARCPRGIAERGYMLMYGLGRDVFIPLARELFEDAIGLNHQENIIELNGSERARIYLDTMNADGQANQRPAEFDLNIVSNRLHDKGIRGSVLAKARCAMLYSTNNNLLNLDAGLPGQLLEEITADVYHDNQPDLFLACIIYARMLRDGVATQQNIARAMAVLERAANLGSPEAKLELATLIFGGFIHADGTAITRLNVHQTTEVDILHAIPLVRSALKLNYIDKFVINDGYVLWPLIFFTIYELTTRPSTIPEALRTLILCRTTWINSPHFLHASYQSLVCFYIGLCYQFGQFLNLPNNLVEARKYYLMALGYTEDDINNAINNVNPLNIRRFPDGVRHRRIFHRVYARLGVLRNDQTLIQQHPQNAQLLNPLLPLIQAVNIDTPLQRLTLHPRVSVRGNRVAIIYKDPLDTLIYVRWTDLNRETMDLTYDLKNNFYSVFDATFKDPNIIVIDNNVALCSAGKNLNIYYRLVQFGDDRTTTPLQDELIVSGKNSSMAITPDGNTIVEAHLHENNNGIGAAPKVYYFTGAVNPRRINWHRNSVFGDWGVGHCTRNPAIVVPRENRVVLFQECAETYQVNFGRIVGETIEWNRVIINMAVPQGFKNPSVTYDVNGTIFILGCGGTAQNDGLYCAGYRLAGTDAVPQLPMVFQRKLIGYGYSPTAACVGRNLLTFHISDCGSDTPRVQRQDIEINSIVPGNDGQVHPTRYQFP